ncbi:MAG: ABC transporter ATP-binding protein [Lachnospiraceae bacterium]|nr:ABC transporter ATP-binding protein [Lachnospiraceae bacterium]
MKNKAIIKKVLKELRPYRFGVILSVLFSLVTVLGSLYIPILIGDAVDKIVGKGQVDFGGLKGILLTMGIVILVSAAAQWLMSIINNRIVYAVIRGVREKAFRTIQHLPLSYLDRHPYGDIVSRVVADADVFADGLLMGFTQLFTGVLTILGTLVFMVTVNFKIALVVVLVTPLSLFVARFIAKHSHEHFRAQSVSRGDETAYLTEIIENEKLVKAYGKEKDVIEHFDGINEELGRNSLKAIFFSSSVNPSTRFVNAIVYAGVGVIGALTAIGGGLSVGQLTVFLTYANQYTKPFNEISGVVTELQNAIVCAGRIFALIEQKQESPDPADAKKPAPVRGEVEFDRVSFAYTEDKPLIRELSMKAAPGQHIAIVGRTGCGKTTLINLLMRFYDVDGGSIRVDGIDVREMKRQELRALFGMVLQDTWLKTGTIRENIAAGKPDATEEEIIAAAKASHAHSFIRRLPNGYDTMIGEDGGGLSQGQKQLLCITRVMLKLPPMLILDEATSSIDTRTELRIQRAFLKMMDGRTSFIVAHRLSTIRNADCILVMEDGHVVEQGTHDELMLRDGSYRKLYESQFAGIAV